MKTVGLMLLLLLLAGVCVVNISPGRAGSEIRGESARTADDPAVDELRKALAEEARNRQKLEESLSKLRKEHDQLTKTVEALTGKVEKNAKNFYGQLKDLGTAVADLQGRPGIEISTQNLGVLVGGGRREHVFDVPFNTLGVAAWVQEPPREKQDTGLHGQAVPYTHSVYLVRDTKNKQAKCGVVFDLNHINTSATVVIVRFYDPKVKK